MNPSNSFIYYFSAFIAILGATLYHFALKKLPIGINPIFNVTVIYLGAFLLSLAILPFFGGFQAIKTGYAQLNWVQIALILGVFMIELGFVLMYRAGWNLSTANLITGVAINIALLILGLWLFGEHLSVVKILGACLAIIGVALLSL